MKIKTNLKPYTRETLLFSDDKKRPITRGKINQFSPTTTKKKTTEILLINHHLKIYIINNKIYFNKNFK